MLESIFKFVGRVALDHIMGYVVFPFLMVMVFLAFLAFILVGRVALDSHS